MDKKDILLFGVQGSGKGTQAQIIAERLGYKIFEAGAELRKIREAETDLGRLVKSIIDRGDLVPNDIVMEIVAEFLRQRSADDKIIFDGIPRSMVQKDSLDALLKKAGRESICLFLELPRDIAIARMKERGRTDDTAEVIEKRIQNFEEQTVPVIEQYATETDLIRVNGDQPITAVTEEIFARLSA